MGRPTVPLSRCYAVVAIIALLLTAPACSPVRFISEYDPETDRAVVELHRMVESLLLRAEDPGATFENFVDDYHAIRIDLRMLELRAVARPMNDQQVEQLQNLRDQLDMTEQAHRESDTLDPAEIELFRRGFEQSIGAIYRLELAKKRP